MTTLLIASAGGYFFCFAAGVAVTLAGTVFYAIHKSALLKSAQDELAKLKAKL